MRFKSLLVFCVVNEIVRGSDTSQNAEFVLSERNHTSLGAAQEKVTRDNILFQVAQQRPLRVMIVGDSISQGNEGDWTWRYRIWQWFQQEDLSVNFVGPYYGTIPSAKPGPPKRPKVLEDEPTNKVADSGRYAEGVPPFFDTGHFASNGRSAAQAKTMIREQVERYQPDLILSLLGFNDMGWFVSDATGTLNSMEEFVSEARRSKQDIAFALANVVQRSFLNGRDDLIRNTDDYNRKLPGAINTWQSSYSPIALVNLRENYQCEPHAGCTAAWDGLHPNALGEYQIAQAFSRALIKNLKLGQREFAIPANIPARNSPVPTNVKAIGSGVGVTVTWDAVFGARGFDVRHRPVGGNWEVTTASAARYDTGGTSVGQEFEYQIRTNNGNFDKSDWSPIVKAAAAPQLSAPPGDLKSWSTKTGFSLAWSRPTGPWSETVDMYELIWFDHDAPPGTFPGSKGVMGTFASVDDLVPGHRYTVVITAWNVNGGGLPAGARPVVINAGTPPSPRSLQIKATSPNSVELRWCGSREAAGYRLWQRDRTSGAPLVGNDNILTYTTKHTVNGLSGGTERYEFCLSAINGIIESKRGECVVAGRFGEGPKGAQAGEADCYDGSIPGVVPSNPAPPSNWL